MNLVLLEPAEVGADGVVRLAGSRAAHLLTVLKVVPGQQVRVGLVDGPVGIGTVAALHDNAVDLQCAFESTIPPRPPVDLLLALPRPKVMRRLWAQLAALGVGRIILTNAARVERHYFDTHVLTPTCYEPLLIEGLQQARDTRVPLVSIHRRFRVLVEDALDDMAGDALRLVAHPAATRPVSEAVAQHRGRRRLLAIGPEGGWSAFELGLLEKHGFQTVSMGPRTLRTDTACIAFLALAHGTGGPQGSQAQSRGAG